MSNSDEKNTISADDIRPLLDDLQEFIDNNRRSYGPLELSAALGNACLFVFANASTPTKVVIAQNFANLVDEFTRVFEAAKKERAH